MENLLDGEGEKEKEREERERESVHIRSVPDAAPVGDSILFLATIP